MRLLIGVLLVLSFGFNASAIAFELKGVPLGLSLDNFTEQVKGANCVEQKDNPGVDMACFKEDTVGGVQSVIAYMFKSEKLHIINVLFQSDKTSYSTLYTGLKEKYGPPKEDDWLKMISMWDLDEGRTGMVLSLHDENRPELGILMVLALDQINAMAPDIGKEAAKDL